MAYREASTTPATGPTRITAATREERRRMEFASRGHSTSTQIVKISYVVVMIMMLSIPMFYPSNSNWVSSADIPTAIANGGTGFRIQSDDWINAMDWLSKNTESGAVVASWWDYGYWITTLGNKTTLADNATLNHTRIQSIAKMFISDEKSGMKIAQDLKADYILVYGVGQVRFYGQLNATGTDAAGGDDGRIPIYTLGQGGDESKKQWFMRIGGFNEADYVAQNVKYPTDGGNDQPLHLVYASPSFENKEGILFGIFIYKVNHDYNPNS
jgi:dolichyl-diphosphooligosaccharide--protein glycosyltransferase